MSANRSYVWVVTEVDNDHFHILGVFITKAQAAAAAREAKAKSEAWRFSPYIYKVERFDLGKST